MGVESIDRYGADNPLSSGHTTNTFNGIGGSQLNPYYNNDGSTNLWNPSINSNNNNNNKNNINNNNSNNNNNNNFLPNTVYNISNGQQWTTATLSIQLLPIHFGTVYNNAPFYNHHGTGSTNGIESYIPTFNTNTGSTSASPNTLQVTCTAHIAPGDYHRSTNVQIPVRLGEPVHERGKF